KEPPGTTRNDRRRAGQKTPASISSTATAPISNDARYEESGVNASDTTPPAPAGTIHACCQPSTRVRASSRPSQVATQPAVAFSGTASTASAPGATFTDRDAESHF